MNKDNIFKSSEFHMDAGDILHLLIIDETGTAVTLSVNNGGNETEDVPEAVVATDAISIDNDSFVANWGIVENSLGYYLDVATDSAFTSMVAGFNGLDVGFVSTYSVTGLSIDEYFYRVRAYNNVGIGSNSNTITVQTIGVTYADWFMPSIDELTAVYTQLWAHAVGGFVNTDYGSSTERDINSYYAYDFSGYFGVLNNSKQDNPRYRPCRSFISSDVYALRDNGPASGWIFHIIDNGDGTYTYYEAAPADDPLSNVTYWINSELYNTLMSISDTAIGTGSSNTLAAIAFPGYTDGGAKICNDYSIEV